MVREDLNVTRPRKGIRLVIVFFLLTTAVCGQNKLIDYSPIDVTFNHKYPGRKQQQKATDFMWEDYNEAAKAAGAWPAACQSTMGWIQFRLYETGKIDQVVVRGDSLPTYMPAFFTKRVLDSQPFWTCNDCASRGPVFVTIPISISYQSRCNGKKPDTAYLNAADFIGNLYRRGTPLPVGGIQVGNRELLLFPIGLFNTN